MKQRIFISYSSKDRSAVEEFLTFLKTFERQGELTIWEDHRLNVGESWADSIAKAIDGCTVAILFVTKHFLASDFIYHQEVRRLLTREEKGEVVIAPIFAAPSPVATTKFVFGDESGHTRSKVLTAFQGFKAQGNTPGNTLEDVRHAKTISVDRILTNIAEKIRTLWPKGVPHPVYDDPSGWPFVWLPKGTFTMGSPDSELGRFDWENQRLVTVGPLMVATTPVTQEQYQEIMGTNPSYFAGNPSHPVEGVTWFDAIEFCNRLSKKHGLPEAYKKTKDSVTLLPASTGYRLLTEAEWEYAARAGTQTAYFFGNDPAELKRYAWFGEGKSDTTHPGESKEPSPWGLYDIYGNVWEWCWDWYAAPYDPKDVDNPLGPPTGEDRICRGGSFRDEALFLRSAFRDYWTPDDWNWYQGFRVCRSSPAGIGP
ncbi:MAG: SUMF1/EgtB/PvdO family nonheme iron enzyme [Myxococcales bacterium]|nr:SUMF1/EgtB/PvdO family nonheme iron enzyme [Myxococcales bacterium]